MHTNQDSTVLSEETGPVLLHGVGGILDAVTTAVVAFDRHLRVLDRNASARAMLVQGSTLAAVLDPAHAREHVDWDTEVRNSLATGKPVRYEGITYAPPTGPPRRLKMVISPLRNTPDGAVVGGVLTADDVTGVIHLEQQLAELERLAGSGRLVARVAHELNNPLDGILRYINLALRVMDQQQGPAKVLDYLRESRKGLMRMVQITGDLLVYARTKGDETERAHLNRIVEEAVRSMQDRAADSGVVITASYRDEGMPAMRGTRLYQVCGNLIKNALDAMPSGGMLTITTGVVDSTAVLRFEDTGVGLPQDVEKIFESFYTTKTTGEGTGLGLAICREFVEQLGGTITADHRRGGGAVLTVKIPVGADDSVGQVENLTLQSDGPPTLKAGD